MSCLVRCKSEPLPLSGFRSTATYISLSKLATAGWRPSYSSSSDIAPRLARSNGSYFIHEQSLPPTSSAIGVTGLFAIVKIISAVHTVSFKAFRPSKHSNNVNSKPFLWPLQLPHGPV